MLMLQAKLKEIRNVERILIDSFDIDSKCLDILNKVDQKYRNKVIFMNCNYNISVEDLKSVVSKWKVAEFEISENSKIGEDVFASDKMVLSLLPDAIISCKTANKFGIFRLLTDETLKNLELSLSNTFYIGFHLTSFTVSQVVQTILAFMKYESKQFKKLDLGVVLANRQMELLGATLSLRTIKDVIIKKNPHSITVAARSSYCACKVRIVYFPGEMFLG